MALFSKPPTKKPGPAAGQRTTARGARAVAPSAREVANHASKAAAGGRSRSNRRRRHHGDRREPRSSGRPGQPSFEVAQANPGLCAVLENAALRFASGHAAEARELLEQGVAERPRHEALAARVARAVRPAAARGRQARRSTSSRCNTSSSSSARRRRGKRPRSRRPAAARHRRLHRGHGQAHGGGRRRSSRASGARWRSRLPEARVDLLSVTGFDDDGARLLADALGEARRKKFRAAAPAGREARSRRSKRRVKKGRDGGEGAWLLSLELLQWANDRAAFEDRAVEFAVTFELSPPSWEPPVRAPRRPARPRLRPNGADASDRDRSAALVGRHGGLGSRRSSASSPSSRMARAVVADRHERSRADRLRLRRARSSTRSTGSRRSARRCRSSARRRSSGRCCC